MYILVFLSHQLFNYQNMHINEFRDKKQFRMQCNGAYRCKCKYNCAAKLAVILNVELGSCVSDLLAPRCRSQS